MGFYLNHPDMPAKGKADWLLSHGLSAVAEVPDELSVPSDGGKAAGIAVVCVVENAAFDAAAWAYDADELKRFTLPGDTRPKRWLLMTRERVTEMLSSNELAKAREWGML